MMSAVHNIDPESRELRFRYCSAFIQCVLVGSVDSEVGGAALESRSSQWQFSTEN